MDPFDALSLCGEIAIAVTGFSGVVIVLGERAQRSWTEIDWVRFRMLFTGSLTPLWLVALAFVLDAAMLARSVTWRICSAVYVVCVSTTAFLNLRAAARADSGDSHLQIPRFTSVWRGGALALLLAVAVLGLQLLNVISIHAFWPLLVGAWWGIALSLFAFIGLLFRDTERGGA